MRAPFRVQEPLCVACFLHSSSFDVAVMLPGLSISVIYASLNRQDSCFSVLAERIWDIPQLCWCDTQGCFKGYAVTACLKALMHAGSHSGGSHVLCTDISELKSGPLCTGGPCIQFQHRVPALCRSSSRQSQCSDRRGH